MDQRSPEPEKGLVSLVIPAYNVEEYLAETLDCVFAQTWKRLDVVLVDDGSTDGTRALAETYGDRLHLVSQTNGGVSHARNVGLEHCRGEFVHFMDADDLLSPDFYERLAAPLIEDSALDGAYCSEESFEGDFKNRRTLWSSQKEEYEADLYRFVLLRSNLSPANVLYRRSSIVSLGGFDETIKTSEDYDFQLKFARHGRLRRVPEAVYYYRRRGTSASVNYPMVYRNRLMVARRHIDANGGVERWGAEWRELRQSAASEACAALRYNLKRSVRDRQGSGGEMWRAAKFLASTPAAWPWLLRGRRSG